MIYCTYVVGDIFLAYLFSRRQLHAIMIFRVESIPDLDSGSLPRVDDEFMYAKNKNCGVTMTKSKIAQTALTSE